MGASVALESTYSIEKEKDVKDDSSRPQEKMSESLKSNLCIKEQEILNDKPRIPTKSSNIEKGKEKDDKEVFCHPQEDSRIGGVKDSEIMNKTPNADSKNETIDSNFSIKEDREIQIVKPSMFTKSNNLEKGEEKDNDDDNKTFCHPQEDIPIEEVKDIDLVKQKMQIAKMR